MLTKIFSTQKSGEICALFLVHEGTQELLDCKVILPPTGEKDKSRWPAQENLAHNHQTSVSLWCPQEGEWVFILIFLEVFFY